MQTTKTEPRIVFTGDWGWWQIVSRDEIELDDGGWSDSHQKAASVAGLDEDDEETWVARVTEVSERHSAIREGDFACCVNGIGGDVVFVRL